NHMYFRRHSRVDARLMVTSLLVLALFLDCLPALQRSVSASAVTPSPAVRHAAKTKPDFSVAEAEQAAQKKALDNFGNLPLSFELNKGQLDRDVKFLSRGAGYGIYLTPKET